MENVKLNFDTNQPDKETILPDKNCSICYGRGKMNITNPASTGKFNTFNEKECSCITRQRLNKARVEHSAIYRAA